MPPALNVSWDVVAATDPGLRDHLFVAPVNGGFFPEVASPHLMAKKGRFNAAVSIFGASLTAQSGFSTTVRLHYHFGTVQPQHWMCGDDNFISSSHRVFSGK